jgi:oligopeptidase B
MMGRLHYSKKLKNMKKTVLAMATILFMIACTENNEKKMNKLKAPIAKKIEKKLEKHGNIRIDNYFWLNDRENPEVINYLNAENDYFEANMKHTNDFQKALYEEMKGRIKEDDESVPYKKNGYYYLTRFEKGKEYPIYSRKKGNLAAKEEILFDVNEMAKEHDYYQLGSYKVSPDNKLVAYSFDTISRRQYNVLIKDLETGKIYPEQIKNTTGGMTWANDNKTLFYTHKDETTLRSDKIMKHVLGTNTKDDTVVYEEKDDTFSTFVYKTKSSKYLVIGSASTLTSEYQILDADKPNDKFQIFQKRIRGLEYDIAHFDNHFYINTNADGATNFKLMQTALDKTKKENWTEVIPHREDTLLEGIEIFKDYLVLEERNNGLNKIRIKRWDGSKDYYLPFKEETYSAYTYYNPEFDTNILRYGYQSMTTPSSVIDFNMKDKTEKIIKEQEVLGGKFDKSNYESKRIWATAKDGKKVPMSIVYKKGIKLDGKNPLLLYGYGSYGYTIDPSFSTNRLSLLDRGFVFAIAHIRGSEYLGRQWYEDGKLLHKKNTFTDFNTCAHYLIDNKYTSNEHIYAMGGSAGGLLMGAILNLEPELYNGVVAAVPFVDVMTTMLDDSIPLTTGEYDEWGNPNEKKYYDYMLSYSPYDQVSAQKYTNLLITTGLHDSQVQYWEPAKWVAKLRNVKKGTKKLLLHTNMTAGHGGASGRFEALKETARDYAFIFDLEEINK